MLRILAMGVFAFALAAGLIFVLSDNIRTGLVANQQAAAFTATTTASVTTHFSATGVIDYYPNNTGALVPYLVYQNSLGNTATKALIYCNVPAGHYTGSVHIEGEESGSTVCVDSITAA